MSIDVHAASIRAAKILSDMCFRKQPRGRDIHLLMVLRLRYITEVRLFKQVMLRYGEHST
jgi:hypothetical protein